MRLWIASEGPETNRLKEENLNDDRIVWLGTISDVEKVKRLQECSVLCAPSLGGESFGIVLLEAMAAKTPIVASSIPGYIKLARGGKDALLPNPGDPIALSDGLRSVLFGENIAKTLSKSGRERAEQFSMDELAKRYQKIYERALIASPAAPLIKRGRYFSSGLMNYNEDKRQ